MAIDILLVDDSSVMRNMIRRTLLLSGVETGEIREAGDGREGLEKLRRHRVDLLFIDVNMPVMDGMQMLEQVRANPETVDLPVLIVSTESHEDRIRKIESHRAGFVHKPFTPERLRSSILSIMDCG